MIAVFIFGFAMLYMIIIVLLSFLTVVWPPDHDKLDHYLANMRVWQVTAFLLFVAAGVAHYIN